MLDRGYSQLPVVEGREVLGLFSLRAFARGALQVRGGRDEALALPVEEFVEDVPFAAVTDEFARLFDHLDQVDAVLVGGPSQLQGIVTAMDVLRYLHEVASPFVLISEIELAVRQLIRRSVDEATMAECIRLGLSRKYERLPGALEEMTFDDYIWLVCHGESWPHFSPAFGGTVRRTRARLEQIRNLRNDIFHFRRRPTLEDHEQLAAARDWMLLRARVVEARGQ